MNEINIRAGDWKELSAEELKLRGGVGLKELLKLLRFIEGIIEFVDDYKDDFKRGFDKGWRML